MKTLITIILAFFCEYAIAQYPAYRGYYNPNTGMNNIGLGLQAILSNNYASTAQQGAMYGQAANINAYGNYVVNQSIANINNETAYSMSLNNQILRTQTFFQKRQINRYYRDLEEYQKQERIRLKAYGLYDDEAIARLYKIPN